MACTCEVGPGKFEGESALTFMAYMQMCLGNVDESIGRYDFFRAPFNFDADASVVKDAREHGYCQECIEDRSDAYGMVIYEDDDGFVYSHVYESAEQYQTAIENAEMEESDDDQEAF